MKTKERRYYLIDCSLISLGFSPMTVTNKQFIKESEKQGLVFSEEGFVQHFNCTDTLSTDTFLRILTV